MNWRKWNRILHRDFGYLFFGMTVIYALSGIALNHIKDWNPSYIIETENIAMAFTAPADSLSESDVRKLLVPLGEENNYKKHYYPASSTLKIFLNGGSLTVNTKSGEALLEKVSRRPFFYYANILHYNPGKYWTLFSDLFCGALVLLAITGLFIIKGKKGITGRGAWLTAAGIIIPLLFLIF